MSDTWQLGSRYLLDRQIGSGVMGQVWAGRDVDGHPLAFKLLRPELADDPTVVSRFLQERNLLVGLRSPYVIRVHDLVVEGPRLAIVMDHVAGSSLRALLQRRGNLPPAQVAALGARIARGLAAVHAAGVLHRDLKPENVLLDDADGDVTPKIADFGIASLATPTGHVATANVIGTPQYLAPELGDGRPSGRASDLYALGVTLYEMASGTVPFLAETPVALLRLHADHAPGRPAGIPDELWHLIAALLAKNPEERPSDAAAVAARLEAMTPRLAGFDTPAPLRTPPPTTLLGSGVGSGAAMAAPHMPVPPGAGAPGGARPQAPASNSPGTSSGTSTSNGTGAGPASAGSPTGGTPTGGTPSPAEAPGRHHGMLVGAAIVAALCLLALVAWLLLRDSSPRASNHASSPASVSRTAPPARSATAGQALGRVPLASELAGGAERAVRTTDGTTYRDAIVPVLTDRSSCIGAVRFTLGGRYETAAFLVVRQSLSVEPPTLTARLDASARPPETLGERIQRVTIPVRGARSMTLEIHDPSCGNSMSSATLFLADGSLTPSR